jgi:hypothetical protein
MTAAESLSLALLDLAEQGQATPCQGRRRDRWTSESVADREWAASACEGLRCPLLTRCGVAADEARGAVTRPAPRPATTTQGGTDVPRRSRRPRRPRVTSDNPAPPRPKTADAMARDLVSRGLANPMSLEVGGPKAGATTTAAIDGDAE